ncbi:MAG: hypothetical protein KTR30_18695 [Saprospiraceae bacterium]|nr:hypothetical protein [Saprospiraceae bacterium]
MHKIVFALLILFGLTSACGDSSQQASSDSKFSQEQLGEQQKLWDELMEVHDEVMPKISKIHKLSRQLLNHQETTSGLAAEASQQITEIVKQLDAADESMFSWMNNLQQLKPLQDTEKHEAIVKYLKAEQEKMDKVRDDMLNSIKDGSNLIEELGVTNTKAQ